VAEGLTPVALAAPNVRDVTLHDIRLPPLEVSALCALWPQLRRVDLSHFRKAQRNRGGGDAEYDGIVAAVLDAAPRLQCLRVDALGDAPVPTLRFAADVFAPFFGSTALPRLKELSVARQSGIRQEGLETIVRLFPNLRILDMRGCAMVSCDGLAAALLVTPSTTTGGAATTLVVQLRLPKLRQLVTSYTRWMPKAINEVTLHTDAR
jgi:hypothetical protein